MPHVDMHKNIVKNKKKQVNYRRWIKSYKEIQKRSKESKDFNV